jgi:hypothetical protein
LGMKDGIPVMFEDVNEPLEAIPLIVNCLHLVPGDIRSISSEVISNSQS